MKRPSHLVILAISLAAFLCGCQTQPSGPSASPALSREQLIEKINANNDRIPTLWARVSLYAEIRDPETGKRTTINAVDRDGSGSLQYRAPDELRLRVMKDIAGLVLDVGLNHERFWVTAPAPGPDTMWWGEVSSHSMRQSQMPIRPQDVLEVLAIRPVASSGPGAPTMRYNDKEKAYVLTWYRQVHGHPVVSRQTFYEAKSLEPKFVLLFDPDGELAVRAELSRYTEIESSAKPAPSVSRLVQFYMPQSRSTADLRLLDVTISREGVPNDASFRFPEKRSVAKEIQIDAHVPK